MRCVDDGVVGHGMREVRTKKVMTSKTTAVIGSPPPFSRAEVKCSSDLWEQTLMVTLHDLFGSSTVVFKGEAGEKEREWGWTVFLKLGQSLSRNVNPCSCFQPFPGGAGLPTRSVHCPLCCLRCPHLLFCCAFNWNDWLTEDYSAKYWVWIWKFSFLKPKWKQIWSEHNTMKANTNFILRK